MIIKPNLFIVGAAKSATSSIWKILKQHPKIWMPEDELNKEPYFFTNYNKNMSCNDYLKIFANANKSHKYIGEASANYLSDPLSAIKIFQFNPHSKIIIILRSPVDRAYSLYNWMVQEGYEYAPSFEKALELEHTRTKKQIPNFFEPENYWSYMYFSSGLYYDQVKRYIDLFGENVLVINFKQFIQETKSVYQKIIYFLQLQYIPVEYNVYNKSVSTIHPIFPFLSRKIINITNRLYNYKTKAFRDIPLKLFIINKPPKRINDLTKKILQNMYMKDIVKLRDYLNMDFSDWLT